MQTVLIPSTTLPGFEARPVDFESSYLRPSSRLRRWPTSPVFSAQLTSPRRGMRTEVRAAEPRVERTSGASDFSGHLGVLRQDDSGLERQRRYDFWFRQP